MIEQSIPTNAVALAFLALNFAAFLLVLAGGMAVAIAGNREKAAPAMAYRAFNWGAILFAMSVPAMLLTM